MKKAFSIILAVLLLLSVFVACNSDSIVDDAFDQNVTISFDANGGEGTMAPLKVKKDVATILPPVGFTKDGNVFVWWEDDDGHAYGDKASVSTGKDIVLHAQWKEVEDITADTTVLTPGKAYRTTEDTTISARITIAEGTGSILLILTKDTTLTAEKGISVIEGQEIYIEGKGTLNATGTEGSAGIGGDETKNGGRIHILDGIIISKGGSDGAGIGGGNGGNGGTISIEDGIIKATGGENGGAGIGGGNGGNGGTISIEGGDIISEGGNGGAGIGGGNGKGGETINISGGEIISLGGEGGAGIGGGKNGGSGTITIDGTDKDKPKILAAGGDGPEKTNGIGKGAGAIGEDDIIIRGIRFKCAPEVTEETLWEAYDPENPNPDTIMKTFSDDDVTVTFDANGGTGEMAVQVVAAGKKTELAPNAFEKTGKSFDGWATSAGGTKVYENRAEVTLTEGITLYALWVDQTMIPIDENTEEFKGGEIYGTTKDTTIPKRVEVTGEGPVTIFLAEGTTLTITGGIHLPEGKELTIQGTGKLVADASAVSNCAGIGGNDNESAGKLTVEGGIIEAKGGYYAAGIGGGKGKDGGDILITAGTVTAIGNGGGAGIGGGSSGKGGKTTISGGTVTATGGYKGAGIGAGAGAWGDGGEILITGGTVTAKGDGGGAGIGGGYGGKGGTITIESGTVTATGGVYNQGGPDYGAGIGGGGYGGASGTITIGKTGVTAPVVIATAGGADTHGIGKGSGAAKEETITLNGGVALEVSSDGNTWEAFVPNPDPEKENRKQYMRAYTTVTITFDKNGGEGTMTAQTVHSGVETKLNANSYTYSGYEFAGWAETSTGTKKYDDKASVTLTKDTTLYALWEKSEYVPFPTPSETEPVVLEGGKKYSIADDTTVTAQRIRISGTSPVTIKVGKNSTLDTKGITVTSGQELILNTEDGSRLIADALKYGNHYQSSAIGGEDYQQYTSCGTIVINGTGTVIATGGLNGGAGIGGSRNKDGGDITINGGTIFAYGHMGAGIGGGDAADGGTTTINDGVILAIGYSGGAGIGGGSKNNQTGGDGGTINILGGAVFATAAYGGTAVDSGAGIGGGTGGKGGKITIGSSTSTPTIFATGGQNANGIGNGSGSSAYSTDITQVGVSLAYRDTPSEGWKVLGPSSNGKYVRTTVTQGITISFDANGGSGSMSPLTGIQIGDSVALTKNTFTNGDKIFMGWNTQPSGNGIGCADESSFFGLMDVTLYAQWADGYTTMTSSDKVLKGGTAYEVSSSLVFGNQDRLTIDGTTPVLIYIKEGMSLEAGRGITVAGGQTLIIDAASDSSSYLTSDATSSEYSGAGIGAGTETTCGTIIINGGIITAKGCTNSAGIGGGNGYPGYNNGVVVINGGDVTAIGREEAAGIGGGRWGDGGVITINGGTVKASVTVQNNYGGAGIGGGLSHSGGVITITGGTVTATGSKYSAGIGGGHANNTGECDGGIITISGGEVYAYGGKAAAGIGGGFGGNSGTITIKKDGTDAPAVYAVGGNPNSGKTEGIGRGEGGPSSTAIVLENDVTLEQSPNGTEDSWYSSSGSPYDRNRYMRTTGTTPPTT